MIETSKEFRYDQKTEIGQVPPLFAEEEPEDRQATKPRHVRQPRSCRETRTCGAVLQAEVNRAIAPALIQPEVRTSTFERTVDPQSARSLRAGLLAANRVLKCIRNI